MSDLDRLEADLASMPSFATPTNIFGKPCPGWEPSYRLKKVAPELIAVVRAAQETGPCPHPKGLECRRCYATTEALDALTAKLREVFGD